MFLYDLTIRPIEYLMETIIYIGSSVFPDVPALLFLLSFSVYFLTLPMYRSAERLQEEERVNKQKTERWGKHIRRAFRGEEKTMMMAAYYREQNYSTASAIRSVLPLLLQIPFFMAAYHFLTGWKQMEDVAFLWIEDLSLPDTVMGYSYLHALPFIMTAVNLLTALLYHGGRDKKGLVQTVLTALVFFALLYQCPAGMVLYWTMNNLFSLGYQIFRRIPDSKRAFAWGSFAAWIALLMYLFENGSLLGAVFEGRWLHVTVIAGTLVAFFAPMAGQFLPKKKETSVNTKADKKTGFWETLTGEALLAVLVGAVIPLAALSSSPLEFVNLFHYQDPTVYFWKTFTVFAGVFLLWGSILFLLLPRAAKKYWFSGIAALSAGCASNYFLTGNAEGIVDDHLIFDKTPVYESGAQMINLLLLLGIMAVIWGLSCIRPKIVARIELAVLMACILLAGRDLLSTKRELRAFSGNVKVTDEDALKILPLSMEGKNVVVIMLDRAIGAYIPYLFAERPELVRQFDGFVWYPNTVSFGGATIFGMPAIFGGYDYTPAEINRREEQSVPDKVDEALLTLPLLFGEAGYEVTVFDPPYAGFSNLPDLSIYDPYPYVSAYQLWGRFSGTEDDIIGEEEGRSRNFVFYSLLKVSPLILRTEIYAQGWYMRQSEGVAQNTAFEDCYRALDALSGMTEIRMEDTGHLILMDSNATHSPCLLKLPEYEPYGPGETAVSAAEDVPGDEELYDLVMKTPFKEYAHRMDRDVEGGREHYQVNMATMLKLGEWFDYLRAAGVYDNTRIILVADHGWPLGQFRDMVINEDVDIQGLNPLLMVKDFGSTGFTADGSFMTNADVPARATEGITDMIHPFTGNRIDQPLKWPEACVTLSEYLSLGENSGNRMHTEGSPWYKVKDDIFCADNWERIPMDDVP